MGEKRIVFRISDCLNCGYSYKIIKNVRSAKATILNLSSMGLMMITKEFLKPKKELEITIGKPLGPLTLTAEVLSSKLDWYVTDKNKDMFFTTHVAFKNISSAKRIQVVQCIYSCKAERRRARMGRLKFK